MNIVQSLQIQNGWWDFFWCKMFSSHDASLHTPKMHCFTLPWCNSSGSHYFLDGVSGHGVEEQCEQCSQKEHDQGFDDHPLVIVPQDILEGLQWVEKPHKRRVRSTEIKEKNVKTKNFAYRVFRLQKPRYCKIDIRISEFLNGGPLENRLNPSSCSNHNWILSLSNLRLSITYLGLKLSLTYVFHLHLSL